MNRRELEDAIRKEVEHWPGVTVEFADGAKHPKVKLWFDGKVLSRPYSGTPGDSAFGIHAYLGDMRRVMKQLGASRDKPEPSKDEDEAPYRKPNNGAAERAHHTPGEQAKAVPTLAEKLKDAGVISPTDVRPGAPVGVSDEPAERLLKQLQDRGFDMRVLGTPRRSEVIVMAVELIRDGIYFGLPMEVYRNVPRLGAGGLVDLNKSPGDFWSGSWLDPDRKDEADEDEKKWQIVGTAYHCARLEPDQFEVRYCRQPCKADWAEEAQKRGAVWNGTEIGDALAVMEETKKRAGESVAEQAQRLEDVGYAGVIWPLEYARWEAQLGERRPLEADVWDDIVRDMDRLRGSKEIAAKFTEQGASEVSVFWTDENNIQRKARFDRLEPESWLDMKTFDNSRSKRLMQAINDAIRFNRYYLTAASYLDAYMAIRQLQIRGEATETQRQLIARIQISPAEPECWFIFQQKSGIPNLLAYEFPFFDVPQSIETEWDTGASEEAQTRGHEATRRPTQIYSKGRAEIDYAKRLFALYSGVYRPGEPWAPLEQVIRGSDLDFSPAWLEGRYE